MFALKVGCLIVAA